MAEKKPNNSNVKLSNVSEDTAIRYLNLISRTFLNMPRKARALGYIALGLINSKKQVSSHDPFIIKASEYAYLLGINSKNAYKALKEAAEELQQQTIAIPYNELLPPIERSAQESMDLIKEKLGHSATSKAIRKLNVTQYCDYIESNGCVVLGFSPLVIPYLCLFEGKGSYTTQKLLSSVRLKSDNSCALYQLIRRNMSVRKYMFFDIKIDELKDELSLYKKGANGELVYLYPIYKEFKRSVLQPCIASIKKVTEIKNLSVTIVEKLDRKAHKIRFSYSCNSLKESIIEPDIDETIPKYPKNEVPDYIREIPPIEYYKD